MSNVSTAAFYERSSQSLSSLRARAEALQTAVSSGERLQRSSDDPVAASRLRSLQRSDGFAAIDTTVAARASTDLTLADSALSTFASYVTRAQELATQAASGTLTQAQRNSIGVEIDQVQQEMVRLANSRDSAGHALFGGEATGDAYSIDANGIAAYVGTAAATDLPLGDGQTVTRGLTGPEFLNFAVNGNPTNLIAVVKGLADALQGKVSGTDPAAAAKDALGALDTGLDTITTAQTVVGARLNWIDLVDQRRTAQSELRAQEQADVGGTDIATTITQLQQAMTVLEASQASFTKLASLSLFDLLR
ncbi:flagellar biosynthesis protein FlgL [Novosphingobium sp.]|uniref:flagellin N-terminal helical domain-containing protein n=1 Tax=Novosphingobium sp. TaxID=1874826 RepID=UPI0035B4F70A